MNPQLYKRLAIINGKSSFDNSIAQSSENVNPENVKNSGKYIQEYCFIRKKEDSSGSDLTAEKCRSVYTKRNLLLSV